MIFYGEVSEWNVKFDTKEITSDFFSISPSLFSSLYTCHNKQFFLYNDIATNDPVF